jgi:hypothetical protein
MADEQLIQQLEATLASLKAGDESAKDRLANLVGGDAITVGNIEQSKAVAIGRDIQIVIHEQTLPEDLLLGLQALLDAFREEPDLRALIDLPRSHQSV